MFTVAHVITWLAVGLIGGTFAGRLVMRQKSGFGQLSNILLGCAGAMVGGILFGLFGILPGLDKVSISLRDIVAAFVGSLLLLILLWAWNKRKN